MIRKKCVYVTLGALMFLLSACGGNATSESLEEETIVETQNTKEEMLKEAVEFSSKQFETDFKDNSLRATELYSGQAYQFTGCIDAIETDHAVVTYWNTELKFFLTKEDLMELNTGDVVTIVGQFGDIGKEEYTAGPAGPITFIVVNVKPAYIVTKNVTLTGTVNAVADSTTNSHNCYFYPDLSLPQINLKNVDSFQGFECSERDEYSFLRADGIIRIDGQEIPTESEITISAKIADGGKEIEDFKLISINGKEISQEIDTEEVGKTTEAETKEVNETIEVIDEALQGSWVYDTTTITFTNGRFVYDYIRVSDGKRDTPEGNYEIGGNTITLVYDSGVSAEMDYTFEDGTLNLFGEKGEERFNYIKQD